MGVITVSMDDETEARFRKRAVEKLSKKKGYLGEAITEAVNKWLEEEEGKAATDELMRIMDKGFHMGRKLYTKREDLYDRHTRAY